MLAHGANAPLPIDTLRATAPDLLGPAKGEASKDRQAHSLNRRLGVPEILSLRGRTHRSIFERKMEPRDVDRGTTRQSCVSELSRWSPRCGRSTLGLADDLGGVRSARHRHGGDAA
jgi:hypothetical protein